MSKIATSLSNVFTALDRSASTALHRQLYNQLREAILSGRLSAGTRLPSETTLDHQNPFAPAPPHLMHSLTNSGDDYSLDDGKSPRAR